MIYVKPRGETAVTVAVDRELNPSQPSSALGAHGWLAVAGGASLGAGAIHAAAIGVHAEHRQAVIAFTAVAVVQLAWAAVLLTRPGRWVENVGALATLGVIGGWARAKTTGIAFVRSEEHTSELQSLMRISYAVFCLKKK